MARTKKQEIQARYNERYEAEKEAYRKEKGYKIAYGFSSTPQARRIERNKARAIRRYEDRRIETEVEKKVFSVEPANVQKFNVITDEEFYFNALYSAPGEGDSLIINMFQLAQSGGTPVRAVIQDEDGSVSTYKSMYEFDKAVNQLYSDLMKRQKNDYDAANKIFKANQANKGKSLPKSEFIRLVSITTGHVGNFEVVTLRVTNPNN